jgi:monooxygenase
MKIRDAEEALDVLVIGAGISGIGAAYYLQKELPRKSFAILEARDALGGTWDHFRYPGARSDSDLYTFGYDFKPWKNDKAIADAESILNYLRETASEHGIDRKIRYRQKVVNASWSNETARWMVEIQDSGADRRKMVSCKWIFCGSGYYDYENGFCPRFDGAEIFRGTIVHPQKWPDGLDYGGRKVVIIGSGATAVTLAPALAEKAAHVTLLQRTPSYVMSLPSQDRLANFLKRWLPAEQAHALIRRKNTARQYWFWKFCRTFPGAARRLIRSAARKQLPGDYPVDVHLNPPYDPWDQRLCAVPDGDLFKSLRAGRASIVTDTIDRFVEDGVRLSSGRTLPADIIVTATGLNLLPIGGVSLEVDGKPVSLPEKVIFRGMMLDGVPNFALALGYTNSSWTLKIGLLCEHFCQILRHMDERGAAICVPRFPPGMGTRPLLDFGAGYVKRALHQWPRQGEQAPWLMSTSYQADRALIRRGTVEDPNLMFLSVNEAEAGAERAGAPAVGAPA